MGQYLENPDKEKVFKETKKYASDALAAVASGVYKLGMDLIKSVEASAQELEAKTAELHVASLDLDLCKYEIGLRSGCFLRQTQRLPAKKERLLAENELDWFSKRLPA